MAAREPRRCRRASSRSTTRSRGAARGRPSSPPTAGSASTGPRAYGGRGASPVEVAIFNMEYARSRAPAAGEPGRHQPRRADAARARHRRAEGSAGCRRSSTPSEIWCQLFSEPDAGSDLASLQTAPCRVDGGWLLSGPEGVDALRAVRAVGDLPRPHRSRRAEAPGHLATSSSTWRRPASRSGRCVQITGEAEFNEVFFDEVFVPDDHLVGGLHEGWAVANTTLAHERGTAFPFKEQVVHEVYLDELYALARGARRPRRRRGRRRARAVVRRAAHPAAAQLAHAVAPRPRASSPAPSRAREARVDRHDPAPLGDARSTSSAAAPLWWGATDNPGAWLWQRQWLWSKAASIAGGTSEVQRTIIGERILGLPR